MNIKKDQKNILYTARGDDGTTTLFNCDQGRLSKNSNIIEALGSVDELNAYLGMIKVHFGIEKFKVKIGNKNLFYSDIIADLQQTLFVIQAEIGGSKMFVSKKELNYLEKIIQNISDNLPPIKSFTISGGTSISAMLDFGRALARRSERRVVGVLDEGFRVINKNTISYLNRLSTILFAMSRYANHLSSISEEHPNYNKK